MFTVFHYLFYFITLKNNQHCTVQVIKTSETSTVLSPAESNLITL